MLFMRATSSLLTIYSIWDSRPFLQDPLRISQDKTRESKCIQTSKGSSLDENDSNTANVPPAVHAKAQLGAAQVIQASPTETDLKAFCEEVSGLFRCTWVPCGKVFKHKSSWKYHVLKIHFAVPNYGKTMVCEYCLKPQFGKKYKDHLTTHFSGVKMFTCTMCGNLFQRYASLCEHVRLKHPEAGQTPDIRALTVPTLRKMLEQAGVPLRGSVPFWLGDNTEQPVLAAAAAPAPELDSALAAQMAALPAAGSDDGYDDFSQKTPYFTSQDESSQMSSLANHILWMDTAPDTIPTALLRSSERICFRAEIQPEQDTSTGELPLLTQQPLPRSPRTIVRGDHSLPRTRVSPKAAATISTASSAAPDDMGRRGRPPVRRQLLPAAQIPVSAYRSRSRSGSSVVLRMDDVDEASQFQVQDGPVPWQFCEFFATPQKEQTDPMDDTMLLAAPRLARR